MSTKIKSWEELRKLFFYNHEKLLKDEVFGKWFDHPILPPSMSWQECYNYILMMEKIDRWKQIKGA
jgi:hypothetical protein